ncbi:MAG TPA: lysylphosphatidylglycerol synthase transmembrane domain-containing protein [Solirubrobacteraceae bacterium]|nr:lysylphosphatidylglycerol synthase transmembrane domain-containing protein [Solirubrobacteraceae bacterium]
MSAIGEEISVLGRIRQRGGSLPVRIVVTLALVGLVASQIEWSLVARRVSHGQPLYFLAAVAFVLAALTVGAWRWWRLLDKAGVHLGAYSLARVYAVSTFSNTFLPTSVGGDVTRALLVSRQGPVLTRVATTIVIDRLGGLMGLLGTAWLAIAFQSASVPHGAKIFLGWVTAVVFLALVVMCAAIFRGSRLARAAIPRRLVTPARQSRALLRTYASDPATLLIVLAQSLLYQALISLQLVMLARAIDVHLSFSTAAVVLALVTVVTLIPISIGGFGIREGSYVVLLGGASIAATDAALISLMSVAALFFASLPGALLLMRGGVRPALESVPL